MPFDKFNHIDPIASLICFLACSALVICGLYFNHKRGDRS